MKTKSVDPMAWREIPGWRQDHRGRIYSVLRNARSDGNLPNSTDILHHPEPVLPPERARLYERIIVQSKGYDAWLGIEPQTDAQRKMKEAVLARGPTYESIVFFHSGSDFSL
jgi:hypothetical protein